MRFFIIFSVFLLLCNNDFLIKAEKILDAIKIARLIKPIAFNNSIIHTTTKVPTYENITETQEEFAGQVNQHELSNSTNTTEEQIYQNNAAAKNESKIKFAQLPLMNEEEEQGYTLSKDIFDDKESIYAKLGIQNKGFYQKKHPILKHKVAKSRPNKHKNYPPSQSLISPLAEILGSVIELLPAY
ncbi:unnamed protein product [Brachionus calyciflorus]|uniref:Uncharacterized protein n=1 Tax=Brachionus calyciflorus TaxID=104777 RepID=A0A813SJH0_9BILA|nr:unnamed protein product [Brachionus calyciflorus]